MGIEWALIVAGVAILIAVLAQRRMLQKRLTDNKEALAGVKFKDEIPAEVEKILKKAPLLKGDGKFAYTTRGCIPYANNFDSVRINLSLIHI